MKFTNSRVDLRSVIRSLYNNAFDRWLAIDTEDKEILERYPTKTGSATNLPYQDAVKYGASDYLVLMAMLNATDLKPDDVLYDLGCGAGRVICLASRRRIKRCVGIEYDERLAALAEANAHSVRARRAKIEIRIEDATQADYSDGTIFYLYNPFGQQTMRAVIKAIGLNRQGSFRIIYNRPDYESPLAECSWLEKYKTMRLPFVRTPVSFWRSR